MFDSIVGALIGTPIGRRLRERRFAGLVRRALAGRDVRIGAYLHRRSWPAWRWERGVLVRRGQTVVWRPWFQRWRALEFSGSRIVGSEFRRSAADGDRFELTLAGGPADWLRVPAESVPIARALLGDSDGG